MLFTFWSLFCFKLKYNYSKKQKSHFIPPKLHITWKEVSEVETPASLSKTSLKGKFAPNSLNLLNLSQNKFSKNSPKRNLFSAKTYSVSNWPTDLIPGNSTKLKQLLNSWNKSVKQDYKKWEKFSRDLLYIIAPFSIVSLIRKNSHEKSSNVNHCPLSSRVIRIINSNIKSNIITRMKTFHTK